jgi:hypothetical protein
MKNRNRDGYHFDDDDEVEDGATLRTPMMVMDGREGRVFLSDTVRFEDGQPHFLRAVDATSKSSNLADLDTARDAARAARDVWIADMSEAWRSPQRGADAVDARRKAAAIAQKQANMRLAPMGANVDPSRISDALCTRSRQCFIRSHVCAAPRRLEDAFARFCSAGHGHPAGGSGVDAAASAHRAGRRCAGAPG